MGNKIQEAIQVREKPIPITGSNRQLTIRDYLKKMESEIEKALPSVITPERFTRIAMSALSSNHELADSTPNSFIAALMTAAQLGLEVNTPLGHAYLIPFKNYKKGGIVETQFQLGYRGMIDLAYRSGEIAFIQPKTVYQNDTFEYEFGLEPILRHIPAKSDHGNPVYFYAVCKLNNGGAGFEVMSYEESRAYAQKYSKSFKNGPWQTNFESMAQKTVLKQLLKYAPLKSDFARQLNTDETVKNSLSDSMVDVEPEYIDQDQYIEGKDYTVNETTSENVQ